MTSPITLVPLHGMLDPHLLPWLALYELSFPPSERLLISSMLEIVLEQSKPGPHREWLLSALSGGEFVGLVHYATFEELGLAGLWGLATEPGLRGRGFGAAVYTALREQLADEGYDILVFEVERPDAVESEAARQLAERRIGFYKRLGARLLIGIEYMQRVGPHRPPVPMYIMAQFPGSVTPEAAFGWAKALFRNAVRQVGELGLE